MGASSWSQAPALLAELRDVLGRPKFRRWVSSATATDFVDGFQEAALVSDDPPPSPPRLSPDPDAPAAFPA